MLKFLNYKTKLILANNINNILNNTIILLILVKKLLQLLNTNSYLVIIVLLLISHIKNLAFNNILQIILLALVIKPQVL